MDLRKVYTFIRVVEAGNFSKAEEVTYTSRQALKKQVDSLEKDLGFRLFTRNSKGVSLTPAGKEFYSGALRALDEWEELSERCRGIANNESVLRIANPPHPHLVLEPAFLEFSRKFPDIRLEIVFLDKEEMLDAVLAGAVDLAETISPRKLDSDKLDYYKLMDMTYHCMVSDAHPHSKKKVIFPEDLNGAYVGLRGHGNMELAQLLRSRCENIQLIDTMGNESQNLFRFCYNQGIYISRAPFMTRSDTLKAIPLITDLHTDCGIVYAKNHSAIVDAFLDVVRDLFPCAVDCGEVTKG